MLIKHFKDNISIVVYVLMIALVFSFLIGVYIPKTTKAAMSKEVGTRLINEYNKECKSYDPSAKNSKKTDRCNVVRADLAKEAKCNFGTKKATAQQINNCKTKVNNLQTKAQMNAPASNAARSSAVKDLSGIDITPVKDAGANADQSTIDRVVNIVFSLAGGLALLFTVIGGLRFILSSGDPQNTARAKNTIIYALVGLLVTMFAFAIVKFVTSRVL